ncbi:HET domain containing protein [Pyrenophora tritici-repentis]|nr:HET domain containing protein [Pyrenophora tritici-repentis]
MAEVVAIISGLFTAGNALNTFAQQVRKWKQLSERLFDISEGLDFAQLSLDRWQDRYDIQVQRPDLHTRALFGKEGHDRIMATLGMIKIIFRNIENGIKRARGVALKAQPTGRAGIHNTTDDERVKECLWMIRRSSIWSYTFFMSVMGKADELEVELKRLQYKITLLDQFSDYFFEREHPENFSRIKRLPGRRLYIKFGDGRTNMIPKEVLDVVSAQRDAELLHRCSIPSRGNRLHIGLSVPRIYKRDFALLLSMSEESHEVLVHPKKIKRSPYMIPQDLATAVSALAYERQGISYLSPLSSNSAGFEIRYPPTTLLADLEYKDALANIIRNQHTSLSSRKLYSQDQNAIASGIAQGSARLIGSQWLTFLDCANVRWRRTKDGQWTCMLTATPGLSSTTRALEQCREANHRRRDERDISQHIQIFRIGLVLAEIALKSPISYIEFDSTTYTVRMYVNDGREIGAHEIASEVELKSNMLLANMVFFCLNVLQDNRVMGERSIDGSYFETVSKQAEELDNTLQRLYFANYPQSSMEGLVDCSASTGATTQKPKYDNFYSPQNEEFYSKFQYCDLNTNERRIRLLRVHPSLEMDDKKSRTQCELLDNISMADKKGHYTTLSYCAGDPKKTEIITVNGIEFNAFANLGHALRQARHFWRDRFDGQELLLWADQVCINQSNPSERSHQVGFMAEIYKNATQVLVSLTSEGDRTGGLEWISQTIPPEAIRQAVDTFSQSVMRKDNFNFPWHDGSTVASIVEYYQRMSPIRDIHVSWTTFVDTVLNSPWWARAWIRQEFILSPDAYLMASFDYTHWLNLIDWSDGLRRTLLSWLTDRFVLRASDPRDQIYALLGLASESYGVQPDYVHNKCIDDVYIDVAIACNKYYGYLATLSVSTAYGPPSWVPTWSSEWHHVHLEAYQRQHHKYPLLKSDEFGRKDGILPVRGIFHGILYESNELYGDVNRAFQTSKLKRITVPNAITDVIPGDEVWMLYGCSYLNVFRPKGEYYRFIGQTNDLYSDPLPELPTLIEEVITLTEANDHMIRWIEIC